MPRGEPAAATSAKKTTTIEETIPLRGAGSEESWTVGGRPCTYNDLPDPWWYIEHLAPEEWHARLHCAYIYRLVPASPDGASPRVGYFDKPFTEEMIAENWGGRTFRILMKRRGERLFDFKVSNELAPKFPEASAGGASANGAAQPGESLNKQLMDLLAAQMEELKGGAVLRQATKDALEIQRTAFTSASQTVREVAAAGTPAAHPPEKGTLERLIELALPPLITALVAKVVAPAPDPIATFKGMMETMQTFGLTGGSGGSDDWKAIAAKSLPLVTQHISQAVHEWASVQVPPAGLRRAPAPITIAPAAAPAPGSRGPQPVPQPQPAATPPAQPAANPDGSVGLIQFIKERLDAGDTGDEIGVLLERIAPQVYQRLSGHSAEDIFNYFQRAPEFRPIATHPRLRQVLAEFVVYDQESDTIDVAPTPAPA